MEKIGEVGAVPNVQPLTIVNNAYDPLSTQPDAHMQTGPYQNYCGKMAKFLSQVSGWSYSDKDTFKNKLSYITLDHQKILVGGTYYEMTVQNDALFVQATAQLILSEDNTIAIISFRGTEVFNPLNWLTDATTKLVPLPIVKNDNNNDIINVHLGFKRNVEAVWYGSEGIEAKLTDIIVQPRLQAIYLTGHSLGGAMAVLAGLCLQQQHTESLWSKVRGIYTYGQPMVVYDKDQEKLQTLIGLRIFRHIYYNDIIPHLPPLSVGAFDHVGDEYKYHPNTGWKQRTNSIIDSIFKPRATQVVSAILTLPALGYDFFWDNIQWKLPFSKSPWSIADHNPGNYMETW